MSSTTTKSKRKLDNWLTAFSEWTLPRSEAPASMIHWTGIFTIASLMKRKVKWPKEILGSYELFPNLYVLFVANPGVARKSTTAGYAEDLLVSASGILVSEQVTFAATALSESQLLKVLAESPDGSMTVISSEFSSFIKTSPEGMYEILTDIYDGKRKFEYATRQHGVELTEQPSLSLLAATTPSWIAKQPPAYFIGGGFASRTLFIYERKKRRSKMYYDDVDHKKIKKLESDLLNDLAIMAKIEGEFKHDGKKTRRLVEDWYQEHDNTPVDDPRMSGYHSRKDGHLHKLMMILSIADGTTPNLVVTEKHFHDALELLDSIEENMPRALTSVSSNPLGTVMEDIEDYIHGRGEVTKKMVATRFWRDLPSHNPIEQLDQIIDFLVVKGTVEKKLAGTNPKYKAVKDA